MKIDELLSNIENVARSNKINTPYIVGGIPRDRILGKRSGKSSIKDIDITTGSKDSLFLAEALHRSMPESKYRTYDDGHASLDLAGIHIDFSSHFVAAGVEEELRKMGKTNLSSMKLELYSRDFTMNTLLESLDFTSIYDLTGEAIGDIQAGLIRCPINPEITISVDPRRILRAIKFATKFDFKIDDKLKTAMLNNRKKIQELPVKFVQDKMSEIARLDDSGTDMLIEYKLLSLVPLSKTVSDILIQKRQLVRAL
jgi:poly(A) polymerase